jgi:antitoxin YefM
LFEFCLAVWFFSSLFFWDEGVLSFSSIIFYLKRLYLYRIWYTLKLKEMLVVSSREFRDSQKKYFDLAAKERVIIKRKNEFLELVPRGNNIPENPSPSNDPWFDDPRNIEELERRLKKSESGDKSEGVVLTSKEDIKVFFESL